MIKKSSQRQEVFEENCGDDGNFITILAMTISYLIITLFKTVLIGTNIAIISFIILAIWWLVITASITILYWSIKNKEI
ncbi:hypothetical protein KAU33_16030 [Candidatus Dependentiae bacterium]|nr:hypothetical protein [Candidatus Dependentiae bacterium]